MRLYHGSNIVIDSINLAMCRPYKDFGRGFYLTDIRYKRTGRKNGCKGVKNLWRLSDCQYF